MCLYVFASIPVFIVFPIATAKLPWPNFTNDLAALFHVATATKPPPVPPHVSPECGEFITR